MPETLEKSKKLQVNYPKSSFTFKNLEVLNPDIKTQTLRLRIKQALKSGLVTKSDSVVQDGGPGRAEHIYVLMAVV